jgi:hypothetical protein
MRRTPNPRNYFSRILALAIACCLVLFVVQLVVHGHERGRDEGACRVCHAAHFDSAPAINTFLLAAPLLQHGSVRELAVQFHKELLAHDSPSRAPPAA